MSNDNVTVSGHASVFGVRYDVGPYAEIIERGAFKRSLNNTALDVPLLLNHEGLPLARTTSGTLHLSEDERGLAVRAELDGSDPDVQRLRPKMARGDLNEMSFAFRCVDDSWEERGQVRRVRAAEIHRGDVSIVTRGASPTTRIGIRAFEGLDLEQRKELVGQTLEFRGQITAVDGQPVVERDLRRALPDVEERLQRARRNADLTVMQVELELGRLASQEAASERRLSELRARRVTERDRQELGWQARTLAADSALTEGEIVQLLTSRSFDDQQRGMAELRRS